MDLIPPFDFQEHVIKVWTENRDTNVWIALMGFLTGGSCGLVGVYLIWRRMALVGDAISHSVLPGIAIAFLFTHSRGSWPMFLGALCAGMVTTVLIELIHRKSRVKQDAAIGIVFTSLFALGVILISLYASQVDLDQDCVLYGEIAFVPLEEPLLISLGKLAASPLNLGPTPVARMGMVALLTVLWIVLFYKELLVCSFDAGLANSLGMRPGLVHYLLMAWLSVVVVAAFESVGAILVIAMLILPGAVGALLSQRLPLMFLWVVIVAALSAVLGLHLSTWLDCSAAGAMVVSASFLFLLAWLFSPTQGLVRRALRAWESPAPEAPDAPVFRPET